MTINSAVAKLPACVWFGNSCGCAVLGKTRGTIIAETTPALPRSSWLIVIFDFVYEFPRNSWGIPFVSLQGTNFNKMLCFFLLLVALLFKICHCNFTASFNLCHFAQLYEVCDFYLCLLNSNKFLSDATSLRAVIITDTIPSIVSLLLCPEDCGTGVVMKETLMTRLASFLQRFRRAAGFHFNCGNGPN